MATTLIFLTGFCLLMHNPEGKAAYQPGPSSSNLRYYYPLPAANPSQQIDADVCVYGGTSGGVTAAVQAARMGKKAVLVEFGKHLGGLTSGGLSAIDWGGFGHAPYGGMCMEFFDRTGKLQGSPFFAAAEQAYNDMAKEASVGVYLEQRLLSIKKAGTAITEITMENGNVFRARVFIDATYEGDLMAAAGVTYHVGREANSVYQETLNGIGADHGGHQFTKDVDPFVVEGDPKSGLLPGISAEDPGKKGDGDRRVQAYNFRMQFSKGGLPFPKPPQYDPARYELLLRYIKAGGYPGVSPHPGDNNNNGGFSTDNIGRNYDWPDGAAAGDVSVPKDAAYFKQLYEVREKIYQDHVNYQQGLVWFLAHDERLPAAIRDTMKPWGLTPNQFPDTGGWPYQLYVREGRRMIADYVMTEHDCLGATVAEDSVGLGVYNMDSHHCQRAVIHGKIRNEGDVEVGIPKPYPISYRSIVPKGTEGTNLLVPVALSASHIGYGSIRMEPVFMILGQSAGTAAVLAIEGKTTVQKVDYAKLNERLLADKQVLAWTGPAREKRAAAVPAPPGIQVDDAQAEITGEWKKSTVNSPFAGDGYLHDGNADKGKKTAKFVPDLPADGTYDVYLLWSRNANRATNVPVDIVHAGGTAKVAVNQRDQGGWVKIFTGQFNKGRTSSATIRTDGTDGFVIADAVRWVPAAAAEKK